MTGGGLAGLAAADSEASAGDVVPLVFFARGLVVFGLMALTVDAAGVFRVFFRAVLSITACSEFSYFRLIGSTVDGYFS